MPVYSYSDCNFINITSTAGKRKDVVGKATVEYPFKYVYLMRKSRMNGTHFDR